MEKINLLQKFEKITSHWDPRIAGALNGQLVKLVRFQGDFVWHSHENEDELFFVVKGSFIMELRDGNIQLNEGEMLVVPRGVEHRPVAREEAWVMLFEPASTLNTGNVENSLTKHHLETI